ncbi:hypothetical protein PXH67_43395 (plasmid) [Streptomyces sp. P8-A8]|uniref:hypothetical protein n=1 Tax=Streptomyces sp. P8-A8 TaxID=3029759 RepID=UPI0036DF273B
MQWNAARGTSFIGLRIFLTYRKSPAVHIDAPQAIDPAQQRFGLYVEGCQDLRFYVVKALRIRSLVEVAGRRVIVLQLTVQVGPCARVDSLGGPTPPTVVINYHAVNGAPVVDRGGIIFN